jgi:uncharacterized membrane protein YhaH (DUF805 family)
MSTPVSQSMYLDGAPVSFRQAYKTALQAAFIYHGRASRSAYWWFVLVVALAYLAIALASALLHVYNGKGDVAAGIIIGILLLGMIYPGLATVALTIRRLHDTDRSGWWYLILLLPYVGVIILVVILARGGTPGPNRYQPGAVPLVMVRPGRTPRVPRH